MTTRSPLLTTRFGAYYHREVPAEDTELTHIGPGTPCGEYFRRFWQPIALAKELPNGADPLPIDILGEELVLFRDETNRIGLLDRHCCHPGSDLSYGRVECGGPHIGRRTGRYQAADR